MPARESEDLVRHTIRLYKGDAEAIEAMYPELGFTVVARRLVRNFVKKNQERAARASKPVDLGELDLEL